MNSLADEFAGKGLIVVGVTSDMDTEATDEWVRETGARYPYGYDEAGAMERKLGVRSIPHAVLVDPTGKIVYSGHPAGLDHELVTTATKNALQTPLWKNEAAKDVLLALRRKQYGAASQAAAQLGEKHDGPRILAYVEQRVEALVYAILEAQKEGDFLGVETRAKLAIESLAGTPKAKTVALILNELAEDEFAQRVITGQRELAALNAKLESTRSKALALELLAQFEALIRAYPDSIVARHGNEAAAALAKRLKVERKG